MTKSYVVVFAKCKGSNFSGHAPDVPGCISAGDTLSEMQSMMREALESHLELLVESGGPIPEAATEKVELTVEDFDDVEYFVIQKLTVDLPATAAFTVSSAA